jgi:hypothetical protein
MAQRLTTSRYVRPGVYIGQIIQPSPGNLTADARVTNYVGKGSRFAVANNQGIRRSFVFEEDVILPKSAPFIHNLAYSANGVKDLPARVYDSITGEELLASNWNFQKVGNEFKQIIINPDVYNANAAYKIDYQSTSRDVKDPLPVRELRFIKSIGLNQDRAQFEDLKNYFIPFTFTGPVANSGNAFASNLITGVTADVNNFSSGGLINTQGDYTHDYNRFYELEVVSVNGVLPPYTATFKWSARRFSGGKNSEAPTPLHSTAPAPTFVADQTDVNSLVQNLEFGVQTTVAFGPQNFQVGDKFYFNAAGAGKIEFNSRYYNTNQYTEYTNIVSAPQVGSTGMFSYAASNNYIGHANMKYKLQCTAVSGSAPNRSATFAYATYGDLIGSSGSLVVNEGGSDVVLPSGIRLAFDFGALNFVAGDVFSFEVKAPRMFYQAKDDREIRFDVSTIVIPGADEAIVNLSYATGTQEGGYGAVSAEMNLLTGSNAKVGEIVLPDNVSLYVRNMIRGNINEASYAGLDKFTSSITSTEYIDWSLTQLAEEVRETTSFSTDVTGASTGVVGSKFAIVSNIYTAGTVTVVDADSNAPVGFFEVPGTRYVGFTSIPTGAVRISYEFRGAEPTPGQLYYISAKYKRPVESYNKPTLILDAAEGRRFLAPAEVDNHLYIMNELAFKNNAPGIYVTQPLDADGDGIITPVDVQESLIAHESVSRITDLCILSFFGNLSDSLAVNERANDPFEKREQMLWVGAPIGTPIGDIDTENSLVFLARRTMQVSPQSAAQGTRVLVAPTECRVDLKLDNGTVVNVTLDGSFVAGATSALVNSFNDPADTILRKNLTGFTYIQTYSEPQDEILGQASITYMSDQGSGVYRFEEDITIHDIAEEFQLINVTIQKQFVTKVVRRNMDESLVGIVPPSLQSGLAVIRSTLANILIGLLGRGLIAQYRDDSGANRDLNAEVDIVVFKDEVSETLFYFGYTFFVKSTIKRLFGLYQVNQTNFASSQG